MSLFKSRVIVVVLAVAFLFGIIPQQASAHRYSVVVNGTEVHETLAELRDGQLMVSVRPFAEAMGSTVAWNQADQRVTIARNGSQFAVWLGTSVAYKNGKRLYAPVAPYLKQGRSMVPAWWLAVQLGGTVRFTDATLVVTIGGGQSNPGPAPRHPLAMSHYVFPFPQGATYEPYIDSMGAPRFWQGQQFAHEGIDIFARTGTPVVAVASGTVVRYGWNTLGGYRVTVQLDDYPEYRFYYAHLDRYAPGLYVGARVQTGQLLGYVGSTGEGPERTEGKFPPHLHFGIYGPDGAINCFELLRFWERNRSAL
jgi:murein DD-endopeptidase MepM/ murein hydrolase activator NlpD